MRKLAMLLAALMALFSFAVPASAQEGRGQPFITAEYYQDNISLEQFRENPRSFFRSEAAFDLIVDYVGDEIGVDNLTDAQFIALVRDGSRTRVRDCAAGERINTGAFAGNQFHWFVRDCRSGEQIVQMLVNGVWIDLFSLGCLNAVEDPNPVAPPALTDGTPPALPQRGVVVVTTTVAPRAEEGSAIGPFLYGYPVAPSYRGGDMNINAGSRSSSSSSSTSGNGGCTSACTPAPNPNHTPDG